MGDYLWFPAFVLLLVSLPGRLSAQQPAIWHDPSPHKVQFVTVDKDVKLEVLDWGGTGRPLVLLAGAGETAHVFDDFAPKLATDYHVYGITRRGFAPSSIPAPTNGNYSADRLGDDVLAVLDALKLNRPVLVGHSIAGEELSSIGSRHPERVAGLIYLDAGYGYAYYDRSEGFFPIDLQNVKEKLNRLGPLNLQDKQELVHSLLQEDLPAIEKGLKQLQTNMYAMPAPAVPAQPAIPESDLRLTRQHTPDGHFGKSTVDQAVLEALLNQEQKYAGVRAPVLAIYADPHNWGTYKTTDEREAAEAIDKVSVDLQAKAFQMGVPSARVVFLPHAHHYIFISNEADVLREMRAFLKGLP